jgi:isopentenyldiphosphate isomerase
LEAVSQPIVADLLNQIAAQQEVIDAAYVVFEAWSEEAQSTLSEMPWLSEALRKYDEDRWKDAFRTGLARR